MTREARLGKGDESTDVDGYCDAGRSAWHELTTMLDRFEALSTECAAEAGSTATGSHLSWRDTMAIAGSGLAAGQTYENWQRHLVSCRTCATEAAARADASRHAPDTNPRPTA